MTHARNKVLVKDDQALRPGYQKAAGHAVNQYTSYIDAGFIQSYDQLFGAPAHDANDSQKLVGDYYIVDFNGDGIVDNKDQAPYGYTIRQRIRLMQQWDLSGKDSVHLH